PVVATINGALGGAALTDLSKGSEGNISRSLMALAECCGMDQCGGLMAALILAFLPIGFLMTYVYQSQIMNLIVDQVVRKIEQARDAVKKATDPIKTGDVESQPKVNPVDMA